MSDLPAHRAPAKAPFPRGAWVAEVDGGLRPVFGRVLRIYLDDFPSSPSYGAWLIDLQCYGPDGGRIGRVSPAMGGPKSYEPCLTAARFRRIREPSFPFRIRYPGGYERFLVPLENVDEKPKEADAASRDEWVARCAAVFRARGGMTQREATAAAEAQFENCNGDLSESPEDAAEEEISCGEE